MKKLILLLLCLVNILFAGSFRDSRDGQVYKTVKIGEQVWMAQNLNYEMNESACYEFSERNCKKYGRLYTWSAAKFACPKGWHLPDTTEWIELFETVGGSDIAGKMLKSKNVWKGDEKGNNAYGFSALPAGQVKNGGFWGLGIHGSFWTSSTYMNRPTYQHVDPNVYICLATFLMDSAYKCSYTREYDDGYSVRCVKDY